MSSRPSGHPPKLAYRNGVPSDGSKSSESRGEEARPRIAPGASIREIRDSVSRNSMIKTPQISVNTVPQKKKPSLLGGLFTKEPSMVALDQVAAQMMAQKGSISPKTIPHVSSQKMPDYVPKVNSKWDGVPEGVKQKEKQTKDRQRTENRQSMILKGRAKSIDPTDVLNLPRRTSNAESWDSRSSGSRPVFHDPPRPESLYSTSSNESSQARQRPTSFPASIYRSPSGSSLRDSILSPSSIAPTSSRYLSSTTTVTTASSRSSGPPKSVVDEVSLSSPGEYSQTTKHPNLTIIASPPIKYSHPQGEAFFAGEARPLELPEKSQSAAEPMTSVARWQQDLQKRPDSSRARLGLRASMIVRSDAAPWESQEVPSSPKSPRVSNSPLSKTRFFSKN